MERILIACLLATNVATGLAAFHIYEERNLAIKELEVAASNKTTDRERELYGKGCVDWLQKTMAE